MNPILIISIGAIVAVVVTLIEPFWVLPVFILGNFIEPVQYMPQLKAYSPTVLLGALIMVSWFIHLVIKGDFEPAKCKQTTFAYLFVIWVTISSIVNHDTGMLVAHARSFIPYFIFLYMVKDQKKITVILWVFIIFGVIAGVYGLYCAKMNIGVYDRGIKRITSFFANPNVYGEINTLLIPLAIAFLFDKYPKTVKAFLIWTIALFLYGMLISGSRKCFFALIPAVLLTTSSFYTGKGKIIAVLGTIFCLCFTYYIFPSKVKYRYTGQITRLFDADSVEDADPARANAARAGYAVIIDNPLFGVGRGGYQDEYADLATQRTDIVVSRNSTSGKPLMPHNSLLEAGAFFGIPGLIFFISLVYFAYRGARRAQKNFKASENQKMVIASIYLQVFIIAALIIGQMAPFFNRKIFLDCYSAFREVGSFIAERSD